MNLPQLPDVQDPAEGDSEVTARLRVTDARFSRLFDLCASVLGESVQATEKLSERVSSLRREIESFGRGRRDEERH